MGGAGWAGPCQGVCFEVAVSSARLQVACLLMGGSVFLSCWLFDLRLSSTVGCRLLGGAGSWCQNVDVWERSL